MRTLRDALSRPGAAAVVELVGTVALLTALALWVSPAPAPAADGEVSLPRTLAGPAVTTATAQDAPAGQAVMIAGYPDVGVAGDLFGTQDVLVGATRNSYRVVPAGTLLDPNGRQAILPGSDGRLTLLDLTTGHERHYSLNGTGHARALAFSPDGDSVLCGGSPTSDSNWVTAVELLDLSTGRARHLKNAASPAAAFAPDGKRLAMQVNGAVLVLDTAGHQLNRLPAGELPSDDAWSPDGKLLAYQESGDNSIDLVPVDRTSSAITLRNVGTFLAWRGPDSVLTYDYSGRIRLADLDGRTRQVAAMPARTSISDVAGGLVPALGLRSPGPSDRGSWPHRLRWPHQGWA